MQTATGPQEPADAATRRIELILRQIDSLPTLPAVATRLLSLTTADDTHAREVVQLISADPALTARILALCRGADLGIRRETLSVERAVMLLGFNAVRNAVLSIQVFEMFGGTEGGGHAGAAGDDGAAAGPHGEGTVTFDRAGFWRHCLAVGIAAELIAQRHPEHRDLAPAEAFVCGLLHDLGKLALDHVLPKAYQRVIELVEINQGAIAEYERRILGVDHHTAGKRLAEQWQLSHQVQDCIWLHGSPWDTLPDLRHKRMVGLVSLADLFVRRQHIGFSGNYSFKRSVDELSRCIGLEPERVHAIAVPLREEVEKRSRALGLEDQPSAALFMQSIQHANRMLGRLNGALEVRCRNESRQAKVLDAITVFHQMQTPGRSVMDVMSMVARSAGGLLGEGYYAMLYQGGSGQPWLVVQYDNEGQATHQQWADPPPHFPDLNTLDASQPLSLNMMGILPWVADYLVESPDLRQIRVLPLSCGWGMAGLLLHDRSNLPQWRELHALASTWGAAIAAANQHDGARRLGEQLAEANRALAETQDRLLQRESMARLGEMAAGAAHEMNNPLTTISGRAQLLVHGLEPGSTQHKAAEAIVEQSHRMSDLISALRSFAEPPKAERRLTDLGAALDETIRQLRQGLPRSQAQTPVYLKMIDEARSIYIDAEKICQAVSELLLNALQANPRTGVTVSVKRIDSESELLIQVIDDGCGMAPQVLEHAMDPFYSSKPAGRQVGMGLTRANQLVTAHGGRIDLRSIDGQGTRASITIPLDRHE